MYDVSQRDELGIFPGLSSLSISHLLDDFTLNTKTDEFLNDTIIIGADWLGKAVRAFTVGGSMFGVLSPPPGIKLHQPTSVRWGRGPGFDPHSFYVSEGGGILTSQVDRRVLQFTVNVTEWN